MISSIFGPGLRILRAFGTQATLPLYELDRAHVQTKGTRIRPFVAGRGFSKDPLCPGTSARPPELELTGWRLAHAVKKADCLRQMPFEFLQRLGFFLEHLPALDWRRGNLRLLPGVASAYADFAGSSLAGRIGQGVALLFMDARGYSFAAHYPRVAGTPGPDFIFEKHSTTIDRILVEAKGSFVAPTVQPNIKSTLTEGLDQISKAKSLGARKSYVVGSFLREHGDPGKEPSLVAFVDPENDQANLSDGTPPDLVLRHNYAAWLDAMNLPYAASDLRARSSRDRPEAIRLHTLDLNGTRFGVVPTHLIFPDDFDEPFELWWWRNGRFVVAGMPMTILREISRALTDPATPLTIADEISTAFPTAEHDGEFKGSVLRDGSLLGAVPAQLLYRDPPAEIAL